MIFSTLLAGVAVGLAVAAPLGPVNLLVIRASLARRWQSGMIVGTGALTADVLLAGIAISGVRAIEQFVATYHSALLIIAGLTLLAIGFSAVRSHISSEQLADHQDKKSAYLGFFLTISNPGSFLGFLALFSGLSNALQLAKSVASSFVVVLGVALGGLLWWFILSFGIAKLKAHVSAKTIDRINHWTGVIIIACGIVLLWRATDELLFGF